MRSTLTAVVVVIAAVFSVSCSQTSPTVPSSPATSSIIDAHAGHGRPGYEPAYYNGTTVMVNDIQVRQNLGPLEHAAADFYLTAYPPNTALWPDTPQCNPCDHEGDGVQFTDFHNHVLDSIPRSPGHGEYNPLWRVFIIVPADLSPAGQALYAARLPFTSEADIDDAIDDGVAVEIDTHFYFVCAVVDAHAAP